MTDPSTGETLGQIELTGKDGHRATVLSPGAADNRSQTLVDQTTVDATFFAMVADMAGAPRELVDTDTGEIAGRVSQSLYGRRTWRGEVSSPLLFAGQYEDTESGWAYNRFRFYDPVAGVYGAQDPLGVGPKIATAQGYVRLASCQSDPLSLNAHTRNSLNSPSFKAEVNGQEVTIEMAPYNPSGGHHTPMKAPVNDVPGAQDLMDGAPSIPFSKTNDQLGKIAVEGSGFEGMTGSQIHAEITRSQNSVFRELNNAGPMPELTWENLRRYGLMAHDDAGIPRSVSEPAIDAGITYYKSNGIANPSHWPRKKN